MSSTTTDPRLRVAPPYIGWVPGSVNLLKSAPKVPSGPATGSSSTTGTSTSSLASSGENWGALSGQS